MRRIELALKYPEKDLHFTGGFFAEEARMFTNQGYTLARELGRNAPAPELMTLAFSLAEFENYRGSRDLLQQAVSVANNFSDEVSALRNFGFALIRSGRTEKELVQAERIFERALRIGDKYPDIAENNEELAYTHALTEVSWAAAVVALNCEAAAPHLARAEVFASKTFSMMEMQFRTQINDIRDSLSGCVNNRLSLDKIPNFTPVIAPLVLPSARPDGSQIQKRPGETPSLPSVLSVPDQVRKEER
jgi:hypothetical protein